MMVHKRTPVSFLCECEKTTHNVNLKRSSLKHFYKLTTREQTSSSLHVLREKNSRVFSMYIIEGIQRNPFMYLIEVVIIKGTYRKAYWPLSPFFLYLK